MVYMGWAKQGCSTSLATWKKDHRTRPILATRRSSRLHGVFRGYLSLSEAADLGSEASGATQLRHATRGPPLTLSQTLHATGIYASRVVVNMPVPCSVWV